MRQLRLFDLFPDWIDGNGLFTKIATFAELPFKDDIETKLLDTDFLGKYGTRLISPMAYQLLAQYRIVDDRGHLMTDANNEPIVTGDTTIKLAKIIWQHFGRNWTELYNTLKYDYNPIDNYNMIEEEEIDGTSSNNRTTSSNATASGSNNNVVETEQDKVTESATGSNDSTQKTSTNISANTNTYGFNSANAVPKESTTTTGSADDNVVSNETDSTSSGTTEREFKQKSDTTTTNSTTASGTDNDTGASNTKRTLTRSGNIGVTTTMQMITAQRELWLWDYFEAIFKEVLSILTIPYYA